MKNNKIFFFNNLLNFIIIIVILLLWICVNGKCALLTTGILSLLLFINNLSMSIASALLNKIEGQVLDGVWRIITIIISSVCFSLFFNLD